jgi:alanyl-tRNA synthetase
MKEYTDKEPMHTVEHILNQTMVRMFGCPRSKNAHIERKKSKCDYLLEKAPTETEVKEIETRVNEVINQHLPVTIDVKTRAEVAGNLDLSKLPEETGDVLRVVKIGDYDACACIGVHVQNTSELGRFVIISHDFEEGRWRVRFKLEQV